MLTFRDSCHFILLYYGREERGEKKTILCSFLHNSARVYVHVYVCVCAYVHLGVCVHVHLGVCFFCTVLTRIQCWLSLTPQKPPEAVRYTISQQELSLAKGFSLRKLFFCLKYSKGAKLLHAIRNNL